MYRSSKVVVGHHPDGYITCPLGLKGVGILRGNTYAEARKDIESALRFHVESFGEDMFDPDKESPLLEAFVVETGVRVQ